MSAIWETCNWGGGGFKEFKEIKGYRSSGGGGRV